MLKLSLDLHVRISVSMGKEDFALRVEGLQDDIANVKLILKANKEVYWFPPVVPAVTHLCI